MTSYHRLKSPGSTYFFTLCVQDIETASLTQHIDLLRAAWRVTFAELPAIPHAVVILPDHMHAVLTEPEDEVNFSERWRRFKARVSHAAPVVQTPCNSQRARRERGFWQRRFWEHRVRDDRDYHDAVAYCRADPVRHGLVTEPADWPYSSFRRMGNIAHPT
ncbi:MAG: transposase [Paracoccaceae bacterium]